MILEFYFHLHEIRYTGETLMARLMKSGCFLMKGLKKVQAEMSLSVLAYNLKRVIHILGVPKMMEALA